MPAKSRRARQILTRDNEKTIQTNIITSEPINQNLNFQTGKVDTNRYSSYKAEINSALNFSYIRNEIKWIGIVTGIIVVLLAILYVLFR
jgi:hypothetical protein